MNTKAVQLTRQQLMQIHAKASQILNNEQMAKWEEIYGEFDKTNYEEYTIQGLPSESTFYHGEIIKWSRDLVDQGQARVLLAGENVKTKDRLEKEIGMEGVLTAGLEDTDYIWDYNNSPPKEIGLFDLIISQAMLEHLIDPYRHVKDLIGLLNKNGRLLIHTVCPGFVYHRYPVDAIRFFPDWFEEIAKRHELKISRKRIKGTHIFYMYEK